MLAALGVVLATQSAIALDDSIWRLAGSFNDWNPNDDRWRLTPASDGVHFIEVALPAGEYEFKFVRGGDWGVEHLGQGTLVSTLTQPGQNIPLRLDAGAKVTVTLDPSNRVWRLGRPEVDRPVPIARLVGISRVGAPLILDLSQSLTPPGISIGELSIEPRPADAVRVERVIGEPLQRQLIPQRAGEAELLIRVRPTSNEEWSDPVVVALQTREPVVAFNVNRMDDPVHLLPRASEREWVGLTHAVGSNPQTIKLHDRGRDAHFAVTIHPKHDDETFLLRYHPTLRHVEAIPGDFEIVEDDASPRVVDHSSKALAEFRHDPRRPDEFVSISRDLGLFEVVALARERPNRGYSVAIIDENHQNFVAPMVETGSSIDGWRMWRARIQIPGASTVRYTIVEDRAPSGEARAVGTYEGVLNPRFETPDWAKQAVWYQIFPERFRNGEPGNDPHGGGVFALPWNAAWRTVHPGEFDAWRERVRAGGEDPDRWDRARTGEPGGRFFNVVWDRRYGGDLEGIIEKLDELAELGINALYLNPIFEGVSMHKYDTSDYRHVDDNFGGAGPVPETWTGDSSEPYDDAAAWEWTEADRVFLQLLEAAHERDMKVIIDGVFNHVGRQHPAFQDLQENGIDSPYAEWFVADFDESGDLSGWAAWDGRNGWLPKLKQDADGSLVWPVRDHIFEVTRRWMDPNGDGDPSDGIDGWRLDVPLLVGDAFWLEWNDLVKSINPDAYIVAEIWTDHEAAGHLEGDEFDAQMHYPFAIATLGWLALRPGMSSTELADELERVFANEAPQTRLVQQNLLASHDTDRLVSNLANARSGRYYDAGNRPQQGEAYDESRPDERAYALSRLALVLQATYEGAPMIYYGQEIGMHGADDPSNRKPRPWPDRPAPIDPDDRPVDGMQEFYATWLNTRAGSETLQLGLTRHRDTGDPDVFAFERRLNDNIVLVVINKGDDPYRLDRLTDDPSAEHLLVDPIDARILSIGW